MKKILLTAAAAAVLSTSSAYATEDMFFVKVGGNWSKLTKTQGLKSKNTASMNVGVGYYVMDNARVDLTFDHYFNPSFKGTKTFAQDAALGVAATNANAAVGAAAGVVGVSAAVLAAAAPLLAAQTAFEAAPTAANAQAQTATQTAFDNAIAASAGAAVPFDNAVKDALAAARVARNTPGAVAATAFNTKVKGTVNTLMLNGYVDVAEFEGFKFFVGAGLGLAQVSAKATYTFNNVSTTYKMKTKNNLALAGHVGGSYEFTPGVTGELVYSYKDMGKTKKVNGQSAAFKGHHVGAGVRFDI